SSVETTESSRGHTCGRSPALLNYSAMNHTAEKKAGFPALTAPGAPLRARPCCSWLNNTWVARSCKGGAADGGDKVADRVAARDRAQPRRGPGPPGPGDGGSGQAAPPAATTGAGPPTSTTTRVGIRLTGDSAGSSNHLK